MTLSRTLASAADTLVRWLGKGLHLNPQGNARLALNPKVAIRKLWFKFSNLRNPRYQSNVTSVSSDHNYFLKLNQCDKNQPAESAFSFLKKQTTKVVKIATEVMQWNLKKPKTWESKTNNDKAVKH